MNEEKLKYQIALTLIKGVGAAIARRLIFEFGDEESVFKASKRLLEKVPRIGSEISDRISDPAVLIRAEEEMEFIRKNGVGVLSYYDEKFPYRLKECADSPLLLFQKGNTELNKLKYLAIVGTRKMTAYGKKCCEDIIEDLSARHPDLVIVSGMAYGVDICAHRKSLETGLATIGVLGHGLDHLYPAVHRQTVEKMLSGNSSLISEYLSKTDIDRNNFVARNRIIAGMCDATLVVESGEKGGALLTAEFANSYNRDVYAVPGRTDSVYSKGCNSLIKKSKAALVENGEDIEFLMNWTKGSKGNQPVQMSLFVELSETEQAVVNLLHENGEMHIDPLARKLEWPVHKVSGLLLDLEFKGTVCSKPGGIYLLK